MTFTQAARRLAPTWAIALRTFTLGISVLSANPVYAKLPRVLNPFLHWVAAGGVWAPWLFLALFLAASFLMLWRLEALSVAGFHGTLLGALILPYCSGLGNIIFAVILGQTGGSGADVMVNSYVNNLTNFTFVLGVPALVWGINLRKPAGNVSAEEADPELVEAEAAVLRAQVRLETVEAATAA